MVRNINSLEDVVDWGLCVGCGVCYAACDKQEVTLVNIPSVGIRPKFASSACSECNKCLSICPGYQLDANLETGSLPKSNEAAHEFGPTLEIWEGHAVDPEIRFRGSSGGVLSALALFSLEREGMSSVLHTAMSEDEPWKNRTVQSFNRSEIVSRTGSRYAPASPCEGLGSIESSDGPCVFIGKPCDAAATSMLRRERPELDRKLGLVLTFFCAGTPSTQGTVDLMKHLEVNQDEVSSVHYRGEGWPGNFRVLQNRESTGKSMTYDESWSRLTGYRPLRCNLCPDGLGRVADISCGDAWHKHGDDSDTGRSLVLVRTERGREILQRAIAANYVQLTRVDTSAVLAAQPSLLQRRRELFGRLLAMRLLLIPTPRFANFSLLRSWLRLSMARRTQTVLGTLRRALKRGWWRRRGSTLRKPAPQGSVHV